MADKRCSRRVAIPPQTSAVKKKKRHGMRTGLGRPASIPAARSTSDETISKYRPRCAGYNKPGRRQQRSYAPRNMGRWSRPLFRRLSRLSSNPMSLFLLSLAASLVRYSASAPTAWGRTLGLGLVLQSSDRALVSLKACCQRRCVASL